MVFSLRSLTQAIPLIFVLVWSSGFISAKFALPYIEPYYLLFVRTVLTITVLLFLCALFKAAWPSAKASGHLIVSGSLIHGGYLGGIYTAIKLDMPAGITALVVGLQPLVTVLLSRIVFADKHSLRQWLGLIFGFIGIAIIVLSINGDKDITLTGSAIAATLVSLAGISIGTLYQKRFCGGSELLAGSVLQHIGPAILMAILAWSLESREVIWHTHLILSLAWMVFGLSIASILLLMYMIRVSKASTVSSYFYLVTPIANVQAWWLFDERLPLIAVMAMALVVLGVYLTVKAPSAKPLEKPN